MKKLVLILFTLFCGALIGSAQNVSNIMVEQEGKKVVVSYSIDKAAGGVELRVSTDGGRSFSKPLQKVSGDLKNVQPGRRKIVWDVLEEWEKLVGDNIVFEVAIENQDYVDLGLSVKWAKCNLGAKKPEEYGRYFAWGDVVGQTWNGSSWSGGGFSNYPSYRLDGNKNLLPEYDAANVLLGASWRMPTKAEFDELIVNCTSIWASNYKGIGVAGWIFTSKKPGYTDQSIFLPAAGCGSDDHLNVAGASALYWSSTFNDDYRAWYLLFNSIGVATSYRFRYYGLSIRPVSE